MSAVTGRSTAAAIRATTAVISARVRFWPSGRPSDQDTPALVVAMAGAPAAAIMAALPASQALGKTKIPLSCRARSAAALARWLSLTAMSVTLISPVKSGRHSVAQPGAGRLSGSLGMPGFAANSADTRRALKRRRRLPVRLPEGGAEVAVAGEAELERQASQVNAVAEQGERPAEPQPQLVAVQRHAFQLLEHLGQVDRRAAH